MQSYRDVGLGVVVITYDDPELQQAFVDRTGAGFPLLSDIDTETFTALGILNQEYQPGDGGYGIPYPGVLVIDRAGTVRGKVFVDGYETRVSALDTLRAATEALGIAAPGRGRTDQ